MTTLYFFFNYGEIKLTYLYIQTYIHIERETYINIFINIFTHFFIYVYIPDIQKYKYEYIGTNIHTHSHTHTTEQHSLLHVQDPWPTKYSYLTQVRWDTWGNFWNTYELDTSKIIFYEFQEKFLVFGISKFFKKFLALLTLTLDWFMKSLKSSCSCSYLWWLLSKDLSRSSPNSLRKISITHVTSIVNCVLS